MSTLKDLLVQQEALTKQIEEVRSTERKAAIDQIRTMILDFKLTQADLFNVKAPVKPVNKAPAKYRNNATGEEWTGRGMEPNWIKKSGKSRDVFLIV